MWSISGLLMAFLCACCLLAALVNGSLGRDDVDIEEMLRDDPFGYQRDDDAVSGEIQIAQPLRHRNGRMRIGQLRRGGHRTRHSKHGEFVFSSFVYSFDSFGSCEIMRVVKCKEHFWVINLEDKLVGELSCRLLTIICITIKVRFIGVWCSAIFVIL